MTCSLAVRYLILTRYTVQRFWRSSSAPAFRSRGRSYKLRVHLQSGVSHLLKPIQLVKPACKIVVLQSVVMVALYLSGTSKTTSYMVVAISLSWVPQRLHRMVVALEWLKQQVFTSIISYESQEQSSQKQEDS